MYMPAQPFSLHMPTCIHRNQCLIPPLHILFSTRVCLFYSHICTYAHMPIYIYTHAHTYAHTYTCPYTYTHICLTPTPMHPHMHICIHTHMHIHTCIHICIYIYTPTYIHTCIHICMYAHIRAPLPPPDIPLPVYLYMYTHAHTYVCFRTCIPICPDINYYFRYIPPHFIHTAHIYSMYIYRVYIHTVYMRKPVYPVHVYSIYIYCVYIYTAYMRMWSQTSPYAYADAHSMYARVCTPHETSPNYYLARLHAPMHCRTPPLPPPFG